MPLFYRLLTKKPTATTTATKDSPICEISVTYPVDIYTLQGHKVRTKATSLEGLPKGAYIVNGGQGPLRVR